MAHVILFQHAAFRGPHKHVFDNTAGILKGNGVDGEWNLNADGDSDFNDNGTQSIVVLEGTWEFFADWKYQNKMGELGPGSYPYISEALGSNTQLSSLRPVNVLSPVGVLGAVNVQRVKSKRMKSKRVKSKRDKAMTK